MGLINFRKLDMSMVTTKAEPTMTIAQLKDQIRKEQNIDPEKSIDFVHSGKILNDAKTVDECKIIKDPNTPAKASNFVVLLLKNKPTVINPPAAAAGPSTSTPSTDRKLEADKAQDKPVSGAEESQAKAAATTTTTPSAATITPNPSSEAPAVSSEAPLVSDNSIALGEELVERVKAMEQMGFERADIMRCMHAAYNNPDRAVEYLISGIPEHVLEQLNADEAAAAAGTGQGSEDAAPGSNSNLANLVAQAARQLQSMGGTTGDAASEAASATVNNLSEEELRQYTLQMQHMIEENPEEIMNILQSFRINPAEAQQLMQRFRHMGDAASGGESDLENSSSLRDFVPRNQTLTEAEIATVNRLHEITNRSLEECKIVFLHYKFYENAESLALEELLDNKD